MGPVSVAAEPWPDPLPVPSYPPVPPTLVCVCATLRRYLPSWFSGGYGKQTVRRGLRAWSGITLAKLS